MPNDDYIKRDDAVYAVIVRIKQIGMEDNPLVLSIRQAVRDIPAADVEPVIHCKGCVHSCPEKGHEPDVHCSWWDYPMPPMGFCSKATRKKGEE